MPVGVSWQGAWIAIPLNFVRTGRHAVVVVDLHVAADAPLHHVVNYPSTKLIVTYCDNSN